MLGSTGTLSGVCIQIWASGPFHEQPHLNCARQPEHNKATLGAHALLSSVTAHVHVV